MANCVTCKARCENAGQHRVKTDCISYIPKHDCNNCKHEDCWEYAEPCSSCTTITGEPTNWKPQTNSERLRAMTDEELAKFLCKNRGGCRALTTESYVCDFYTEDLQTDCNACWIDWLRREAKEGE